MILSLFQVINHRKSIFLEHTLSNTFAYVHSITHVTPTSKNHHKNNKLNGLLLFSLDRVFGQSHRSNAPCKTGNWLGASLPPAMATSPSALQYRKLLLDCVFLSTLYVGKRDCTLINKYYRHYPRECLQAEIGNLIILVEIQCFFVFYM